MKTTEYAACDATELADLIAKGEVSAAEVYRCATEAISTVNEKLNVVTAGPFESPLEYDATGPLGGAPFAIKDLFCHAAGVPTRMGSRMTGPDGVTFPHDTELMSRFRRAGLATAAVTTTPEFGLNSNCEAVVYGTSRNPWDVTRSTGGSSGGSSALVAAGAVPIAHANDAAGSIRIPAAYNGLVGLKPTRGRVSMGPDAQEALGGLGIEFAVSRTVRDTALLLDAVSGYVPGDKYRIQEPAAPYVSKLARDPKPLRIAVCTSSWSHQEVDPEVAAAVEAAAQLLTDLGHHVEIDAPRYDFDRHVAAQRVVWAASAAENVLGLQSLTGVTPDESSLERSILAAFEYGRTVTAVELGAAHAAFNQISRATAPFFEDYHILVTPTTNTPAQPLGYQNANDPALDFDAWSLKVLNDISFTPLFNTTGQPALSLPLGETAGGLPIGVQFVGRMCAEDVLLALAGQIERTADWSHRRPTVHITA
ncbi:amidase [Nocardia sp. CA-084685]|uniref:amidase n=1 Tax=Nocardia sp. CA-084685 TaxID=3239970 RepID=UPI003D993328